MPELFLLANEEAYERGILGWMIRPPGEEQAARSAVQERAMEYVRREVGIVDGHLHLTPVLLREESEVEAKINGHESPLWVECTARAKRAESYWRIEYVPDA